MSGSRETVDIICKRGPGDRPMADINDGLITTESLAITRGTAAIDSGWWSRRRVTCQTPIVQGVTRAGQTATLKVPQVAFNATALIAGVRKSLSVDAASRTAYYCNWTLESYTAPPAGLGS